jgi:sigma-B regulation protein RsbQ
VPTSEQDVLMTLVQTACHDAAAGDHATPAVRRLLDRNAVTITGDPEGPTIVFAHGFGCDQEIWAQVAPAFDAGHRVVRFDHVGSGRSDHRAHDPDRHATIDGYAADLVELGEALELRGATYVGHSVSGMIGALASTAAPHLFGHLVLIGASPRYLDDEDGYRGGFSLQDVTDLLAAIDDDYLHWARTMAPVIMGNPDRPDLADELGVVFSRLEAGTARSFARATFLADVRDRLPDVPARCVVVHCREDAVVPDEAARYLHRHLRHSEFLLLDATGHCPLLSAPQQVIDAIRRSGRDPACP